MNEALFSLIRNSSRVYICGNGGSAANAIHWANDLIAAGIRAHALTADIATLTAIANDYGYDQVFSRQLRVLASRGAAELLIALSGSGTSPNIVKVLEVAKDVGMISILITGDYKEWPVKAEEVATLTVLRGTDMQKAEEAQLEIIHQFIKEER